MPQYREVTVSILGSNYQKMCHRWPPDLPVIFGSKGWICHSPVPHLHGSCSCWHPDYTRKYSPAVPAPTLSASRGLLLFERWKYFVISVSVLPTASFECNLVSINSRKPLIFTALARYGSRDNILKCRSPEAFSNSLMLSWFRWAILPLCWVVYSRLASPRLGRALIGPEI